MAGGPLVQGTVANANDVVARKQVLPTYYVWDDGSKFHADSMRGGTDYTSTDHTSAAGVIQSAFSALTRGQTVMFQSTDFPMGTANPAVSLTIPGFRAIGESVASNPVPTVQNGTRFLAGANNQTIFKSSSGSNILQEWGFADMAFSANGFTGITAVDMSAGTETSSGGAFMRNVYLDALSNGSFGTGFILDGQEDCILTQIGSRSGGAGSDSCTVAVVQWNCVGGNTQMFAPVILDRGVPSIVGKWQNLSIHGGTLQAIKFTGIGSSGANITSLVDVYMGNSGASVHTFDINAQAAGQIKLSGVFNYLDNHNFINVNGGTIDSFIMDNSFIIAHSGTTNFADTAASVGRRRLHVRGTKVTQNVTLGNLPAGVSIDGNNYWTPDS